MYWIFYRPNPRNRGLAALKRIITWTLFTKIQVEPHSNNSASHFTIAVSRGLR